MFVARVMIVIIFSGLLNKRSVHDLEATNSSADTFYDCLFH